MVRRILQYMGSLDTSEVHGLRADRGYRVYIDKALGDRARRQNPLNGWLTVSKRPRLVTISLRHGYFTG